MMVGVERNRTRLLLCLIVLAWASAGCSLFAGAASMRIEVEVYKGPLSHEPELQWAELLGFVRESVDAMSGNMQIISVLAQDIGLIEKESPNFTGCKRPSAPTLTTETTASYYCLMFERLYDDASNLQYRFQNILDKIERLDPILVQRGFRNELTFKEDMIEILSDIAQASSESSKKAFSWSIGTIAGAPPSYLIRIAMVNFIVSSSEIANQLHARADALLKQIGGLDRQELPLSVQLRETDATEFIRLYEWFGAHPPDYLSIGGFLQPGTSYERMKAVRRLFADHHWSNINTVYASGWGKGSMALIKDDIGNWNLKNFDTDPEELLKAYKDFTITTLETAVKAVKAGGTGGAGAGLDKLLDVAAQYFTPTPGSSTSTSGIGQFRLLSERTSAKLRDVENQASSSRDQDTQASDEYQKAVEALKSLRKDDPNYAKQEEAVESARKTLVARRTPIIQDIEKILSEHSELVDLLAKGTIAN